MTEIFTLMALGAAFGWIFAKVMEPSGQSEWPKIKIEEISDIDNIRKKILKAENELNLGNYFEGLNIFRDLKHELTDYKDKISASERMGIDS
ncbi:MAG: hypothetical protein ABRQ37_26805, partial [Candidatus Eremiobacterota bacterium]